MQVATDTESQESINDSLEDSYDENMDLHERYKNSRHLMEEYNMHQDYKLNFKTMEGIPKKCRGKDVCYDLERCMYCVPFWEAAVEKLKQSTSTSTTISYNYFSVDYWDPI